MNILPTQTIGAIGYFILAMSYYKKEKKKILYMQIIAYIMFTIHYYMLSGITGAICNAIGLCALLAIYIFEKHNLKNIEIVVAFFSILLICVNIATFQNVFSIFPMIASVIVIISFVTNDEDIIRGIGLISAVCWLIYAIVYKSYIAIIFEVVTLIGIIIAFLKNTSNPTVNLKNEKDE